MNSHEYHEYSWGMPRKSQEHIYTWWVFPWSKQAQRRVAEQQREAVKRTDRAPDKVRLFRLVDDGLMDVSGCIHIEYHRISYDIFINSIVMYMMIYHVRYVSR